MSREPGDPEDLDPRAICDRLAPRVHAVALHFFGGGASGAAQAADVTQEVLVKVMTQAHRWRGDASLETWAHRITVNACLDEARRGRRLVALPSEAEPAAPGGPHGESERSEAEALVRGAVARLPAKLRIAVVLRHFEELSYEEMAKALGCSPGTVASRLSRGHAQLARELRALRAGS